MTPGADERVELDAAMQRIYAFYRKYPADKLCPKCGKPSRLTTVDGLECMACMLQVYPAPPDEAAPVVDLMTVVGQGVTLGIRAAGEDGGAFAIWFDNVLFAVPTIVSRGWCIALFRRVGDGALVVQLRPDG